VRSKGFATRCVGSTCDEDVLLGGFEDLAADTTELKNVAARDVTAAHNDKVVGGAEVEDHVDGVAVFHAARRGLLTQGRKGLGHDAGREFFLKGMEGLASDAFDGCRGGRDGVKVVGGDPVEDGQTGV